MEHTHAANKIGVYDCFCTLWHAHYAHYPHLDEHLFFSSFFHKIFTLTIAFENARDCRYPSTTPSSSTNDSPSHNDASSFETTTTSGTDWASRSGYVGTYTTGASHGSTNSESPLYDINTMPQRNERIRKREAAAVTAPPPTYEGDPVEQTGHPVLREDATTPEIVDWAFSMGQMGVHDAMNVVDKLEKREDGGSALCSPSPLRRETTHTLWRPSPRSSPPRASPSSAAAAVEPLYKTVTKRGPHPPPPLPARASTASSSSASSSSAYARPQLQAEPVYEEIEGFEYTHGSAEAEESLRELDGVLDAAGVSPAPSAKNSATPAFAKEWNLSPSVNWDAIHAQAAARGGNAGQQGRRHIDVTPSPQSSASSSPASVASVTRITQV
jgi:hypothetical protein